MKKDKHPPIKIEGQIFYEKNIYYVSLLDGNILDHVEVAFDNQIDIRKIFGSGYDKIYIEHILNYFETLKNQLESNGYSMISFNISDTDYFGEKNDSLVIHAHREPTENETKFFFKELERNDLAKKEQQTKEEQKERELYERLKEKYET